MKRTATLVVAIMALTLTACKADNNPKKQDNKCNDYRTNRSK